MRVEKCSQWDPVFFKSFVDYRNRIHQDIVTSFPEDIPDYEKFFGPVSPFGDDYDWSAFIVWDQNTVVAKAILARRKTSKTGNLGFIDWDNNLLAATSLIAAVKDEAKKFGLTKLKTPVDLNFYVKYRIRLPGGGEPFWGEPIYPDYYHTLFKEMGFQVIGHWDSYRLNKRAGILDFLRKRKQIQKKETRSRSLRTTIRCVRLGDWENELRIIHSLFNEAYQNMPEWESVTFEQFKLIYDDFKYIINPLYSYIAELNGRPVGFNINYADPLPILLKVKGKKLSVHKKIILFLKLRLNLSTFIIAHVGKIPGPQGEEVKGAQIKFSQRVSFAILLMRRVLVTFQMNNSPSRRSFEKASQVPYAEYVLYGLDLE